MLLLKSIKRSFYLGVLSILMVHKAGAAVVALALLIVKQEDSVAPMSQGRKV
jgi:hypothetical protein